MKIGIIDYGVGNLGSVFRALEELKARPFLVETALDLHLADKIVLPGVGNFADCADLLRAGGWTDAIQHAVVGNGKSLLGICLGMQL